MQAVQYFGGSGRSMSAAGPPPVPRLQKQLEQTSSSVPPREARESPATWVDAVIALPVIAECELQVDKIEWMVPHRRVVPHTGPRVRPLAVGLQPTDLVPWAEDRLQPVSRTALGPGLPHGTNPWAEGPRDDRRGRSSFAIA